MKFRRNTAYQSEAKRNREQFPGLAKIVDEFRAVFGPDVKLIYGEENGKKIGKRAE